MVITGISYFLPLTRSGPVLVELQGQKDLGNLDRNTTESSCVNTHPEKEK
jgi:hypothetical protein